MNPDDVKLIEQRQCPECANLKKQIEAANEDLRQSIEVRVGIRKELGKALDEVARLSADLKTEAEHRLQCQNELFVVRSNLKAHCDAIEYLKQAKSELEAKLADRGMTIQNLQGRLLRGEPDVITRYQGKDGSRDWATASAWLMPGEALAVIDL